MRLSNEVINTALESISYSEMRIRQYDYKLPQEQAYKLRIDALNKLSKAKVELREYQKQEASNENTN